MHGSSIVFVVKCMEELIPPKHVVEFGSRNVNGEARSLYYFEKVQSYTGIDLYPGDGVDIVGDCSMYTPDPDKVPDLVLCMSVLEHTELGFEIIKNAYD